MAYLKLVAAVLLALLVWAALLVVGALLGWWRQPIATPGDATAFMAAAVERLEADNHGDAALLLIEDGKPFAEHYASVAGTVDRDTVFPLASMSKWIAAWAVMTLVQDGRVALDGPINGYLKRWKLPTGEFDPDAVTVARLLSHTAGLGDGLGFADYAADAQVPDLLASLDRPGASSGEPVRIGVDFAPGARWKYSGGGYLVLELLVEDVSGEPFDQYVRTRILQPLGMSRSSYGFLGDIENAAHCYSADGQPAPYYRYAARAATALAASAGDLARFAAAQLRDHGGRPLDQAHIDAMRRPHGSVLGQDIWGLGTMLYAPTRSGDFVFGHDGANEPEINSALRVNPDTGDAIVVLSTGNGTLASAIGFQWVLWQTGLPDFIGAPGEVRRTLPALLGGWVIILAGVVIVVLRRIRRNPSS